MNGSANNLVLSGESPFSPGETAVSFFRERRDYPLSSRGEMAEDQPIDSGNRPGLPDGDEDRLRFQTLGSFYRLNLYLRRAKRPYLDYTGARLVTY